MLGHFSHSESVAVPGKGRVSYPKLTWRSRKIFGLSLLQSLLLLLVAPLRVRALVITGSTQLFDGGEQASNTPDDVRGGSSIPRYVLDYAPLVHLYSKEQFWPCDIAEHLLHVTPHLNYTPLQTCFQPLNLTNLDRLNHWDGGRYVYLQSRDNVEKRPKWLSGRENIPSILESEGPALPSRRTSRMASGHVRDQAVLGHGLPLDQSQSGSDRTSEEAGGMWHRDADRAQGGWSRAPATLVVVQKSHGVVDAFWFFFYSYNLGNQVLNVRFGNHVGDWEHTLVRFQHGEPKAVYFSQHESGEAYSYAAVEKIGKRPVAYSATGTHAMYATAGIHRYVLPLGLLQDVTDRGPLWDPARNARMYTYNHFSDILSPGNFTPDAPVEWFHYAGRWGDKVYPLSDPRQYEFAGQYHYVTGPLGPRFKNLGRKQVCQARGRCVVKNWLLENYIRRWPGAEENEEGEV